MNTTTLTELCQWSSPRAIATRAGLRLLRTASPTSSFWEAWGKDKAACKEAGLAVRRDDRTGAWVAQWWSEDGEGERSIVASRAAEAPSEVHIPAPDGLAYLPYQVAGIAYALSRPATLIADEMGLGKTIQGIGVINADASIQRVLVACPASLKLHWARELGRWLLRPLSVGIVGGGNPKDWPDADIVIMNYDIAAKHASRMRETEWDLVLLDEAHYLKNPKSQRTKALLGSAKAPAVGARRRLALTGTPVLNRPIESQPVLGWLSPEHFGHFFRFAKRYADARRTRFGWDFGGASNLPELQSRLRATIMVRRLKADVLRELPPKRRQVIEIPADGAAAIVREEQDAVRERQELLDALRAAVESSALLEGQDAYAQAVDGLASGNRVAFARIAEARHAVALAKVPYVVEHVTSAARQAPVVLFAHHVDVIDELIAGLHENGLKCVRVVGGMSAGDKQAAVDAFQAGEADVLIGNIQAAGVGITLTRSSHVVFAEMSWVPSALTQAEDRCHRIGQDNSVLVQHLVLEGSLDQVMARAIVRKQEIADKALDR